MRASRFAGLVLAGAVSVGCVSAGFGAGRTGLIVAAEQAESRWVIIDPDKTNGFEWVWAPAEDPYIGKGEGRRYVPSAGNPSDVRLLGKDKLLVICSGGMFARIDRKTCRADYFGRCNSYNPHSIAELPDGRVACATSDGGQIVLVDPRKDPFDPAKQPQKNAFPLKQGHGVLWDAKAKCLWALGSTMIVKLEYLPETMELKEKGRWDFIADGCGNVGHDLIFAEDGNIVFTTRGTVSAFDVRTHTFKVLEKTADVKAISYAKQGVLRTIPRESWWTDTLLIDRREVVRKGCRFYKARWLD